MSDPWLSLVTAAERGDLLAWCVEHAPDGDADAAVRRAWEASAHPWYMLAIVGPDGAERSEEWRRIEIAVHGPVAFPDIDHRAMAAEIRRRYPAPTFARMRQLRRAT